MSLRFPFVTLVSSLTVGLALAACSGAETPAGPSAAAPVPTDTASATPEPTPDARASTPAADAGEDAGLALDGICAKTFGDQLTAGFGRIDGIVYAVQKPSDAACVMPNSDHLVLQVLVKGAVYRMVVNVVSDRAGQSPEVRFGRLPHALPAPAWSEGWHTDAPLDYVKTLGATSASGFAPKPMNDLVAALATELVVGAKVSVYATSGNGRPESAHLVHRNKANADGAIVVAPAASPTFLLFHFDNQTF